MIKLFISLVLVFLAQLSYADVTYTDKPTGVVVKASHTHSTIGDAAFKCAASVSREKSGICKEFAGFKYVYVVHYSGKDFYAGSNTKYFPGDDVFINVRLTIE